MRCRLGSSRRQPTIGDRQSRSRRDRAKTAPTPIGPHSRTVLRSLACRASQRSTRSEHQPRRFRRAACGPCLRSGVLVPHVTRSEADMATPGGLRDTDTRGRTRALHCEHGTGTVPAQRSSCTPRDAERSRHGPRAGRVGALASTEADVWTVSAERSRDRPPRPISWPRAAAGHRAAAPADTARKNRPPARA